MNYVFIVILSTIALVLLGQQHNEVGAVVLGLDAAGIDLYLQWLRFKLSASPESKHIVLVIFGGLIARVVLLFGFLYLGLRWFGFNNYKFYLFIVIILLMVPVFSMILAFKFKTQRD